MYIWICIYICKQRIDRERERKREKEEETKQRSFDWSKEIHRNKIIVDYLFNALTRMGVRLKYLSRSIIDNKSRRFARQIRLAVF